MRPRNQSQKGVTEWLTILAILVYGSLAVRILTASIYECSDLASSIIALIIYGGPPVAMIVFLIRFLKRKTSSITESIILSLSAGIHFVIIVFSLVMFSMQDYFKLRGMNDISQTAWVVLATNLCMLIVMVILKHQSKLVEQSSDTPSA